VLLCSWDLGASGDARVDVGDARDNGPPAEKLAGTERLRLLPRKPLADAPFFPERGRTVAPARSYSKLGRALRGYCPSDPWLGRK
jgi:hypothetical protein